MSYFQVSHFVPAPGDPNQLAHMDPGGCLYQSDEEETWETDSDSSEEYQPENLEPAFEQAVDTSETEGEAAVQKPLIDVSQPLVEPLFALPCGFTFPECAICFEQIEMVNVVVTTCGHSFHASCAFKALENNDCCPMCRHQLLDAPIFQEEEEDEEDEEDEEEDDDESVEEDEEDEVVKVDLEQLAGKLTNMGYTMADLLKFFISDVKSGSNEPKYSEDFFNKTEMDINGIIEGTISLAHRDSRSYAQVAGLPKRQSADPVAAPIV